MFRANLSDADVESEEYRKASKAYIEKVNLAVQYPWGADGEAWNSLYLLGLALQGLTLIPVNYQVEIPRYVVLAPSPKPPLEGESFLPAWELSYIVPEGFI